MLKNLVFSLLFCSQVYSSVSRIAEKPLNIADVNPIHLTFGRISILNLPCDIRKYSVGLPESYKVEIEESTKRELSISMLGKDNHPSNLLVTCGEYLLVFDLIPSKRTHQASLRVTNLYENKRTTKSKRKLVIER